MACSSPSDAPCTAELWNNVVESVAPCFSYRYSALVAKLHGRLALLQMWQLVPLLHFTRFDHTQVVKTCQEASCNQHTHARNLSLLVA